MRYCLIKFSLLHKSLRQISVGGSILRSQGQGTFKLGNRFVQPILTQKDNAKIVLRDIVARRHGQSMCPKRLAIAPIGGLH